MNTQRKRMRAVALVTALACADAMWALPESRYPEAFGAADDRGTFLPDKPGRAVPSKRLGLAIDTVPQVALAGVDHEALLKADHEKAQREGIKILRFGIGRDVALAASDGHWYDLEDGGRLWMADVVSPGALGLRLHFAKARLPRGVEVAVYAPGSADRKARYLETGLDLPSPEPEIFESKADLDRSGGWTGTLFGERARIEVYFPKSVARRAGRVLPFAVDRLQHVYLDPVAQMAGAKDLAGPCHNDVACFPEWSNVAKAVGLVTFVIGGDTFVCTGQLLNAENSDKTPYWLTANHCISTQAVAQTAEVFWRYQTPSCGGPTMSMDLVPKSKGATLLETGASSDFTLLMIEGALPSNLFWAGWTSDPVANGTESTAIHHPAGDYKRISFGTKASNPTCGGANHVRVNWTDGPTEPGSSGSGIFRDDTQQLYGQLHCGPSACGNETNDSYGAFSATFPNIADLLAGGSDDASESNDSCGAPKVITTGTLSNRIVKSTDVDWYQVNVGPYRKLTVNLSFTHANGDVDTALYTTCGGSVVKSSAGTGDTEVMSYGNLSSVTVPFYIKVYLYNDTRNSYDMTITSTSVFDFP